MSFASHTSRSMLEEQSLDSFMQQSK